MRSKQKIIIVTISFGLFGLLFVGVALYPTFQGVLEDHKEVLAHKVELLQLKEDERGSDEFEKISSQYAGDFARVNNLFVDNETPIVFFRFLDEVAGSFGLRLGKAPGPVASNEGDSWPSFTVRLAGEGLYSDVMAFLQKVEHGPYLLEVQTFTLSSPRNVQSSFNQGNVEFSLSLKVFTKPL